MGTCAHHFFCLNVAAKAVAFKQEQTGVFASKDPVQFVSILCRVIAVHKHPGLHFTLRELT